jgi:signal transduction histidine kinase
MQAQAEAAREGLTGVLVFLFVVRWGTWAIALILVAFGSLPDENVRYEPLLLGLTFAQILAATLYVPLLRPRLQRALGARLGPRDDLIALALVDMAMVMAVVYFSGGWRSPYYHYAVSSLLVPTFLFGWRRSAFLLTAFLAGYMAILSTAGLGADGPWAREDKSSLAGVLTTPLLVVVVMQYLSSLTRRLAEQGEEARRAFRETSALYSIAQTVATSDAPGQLIAGVVDTLRRIERFSGLALFSLGRDGELCREAGFGDGESAAPQLRLPVADAQALSRAEALIGLDTPDGAGCACAVPVHVQEQPWGAIVFSTRDEQPQLSDVRLVQAVARQLSLGLTKISLNRQKEEMAAQEERSRIAREIHDGIAQSIYMLSLSLEKAAEVAGGDQRLGQRLGRLVGLAKEALLEVRYYIFDLKPLLQGDAGLTETIRSQIQEFSSVSGLPVQFEVEGQERVVPLALSSSLYRIAQEALANIYRHAHASRISIRLAFCEDSVSLEVRDDGRGFPVDVESAGGRGLRNIHQRASELGGQVEISSAPGQGATVRVTLPVTNEPISA